MEYGVWSSLYNYIHYEENDYMDHLQVYELFPSAKKKKKKNKKQKTGRDKTFKDARKQPGKTSSSSVLHMLAEFNNKWS